MGDQRRRHLADAGAVIGGLEDCTKRKVEVIAGKPSPLVMQAALERLGRTAGECLVIGDSLGSDILMGKQAGATTVLVLTGATQRADLNNAPVQSDYVLERIAEAPRLLGDD